MTNPNTLGAFWKDIVEIAHIVHEQGLLYYDGANMNANLGISRPETWALISSTITCTKPSLLPRRWRTVLAYCGYRGLEDFLPVLVGMKDAGYYRTMTAKSIGKVKSFMVIFWLWSKPCLHKVSRGARIAWGERDGCP